MQDQRRVIEWFQSGRWQIIFEGKVQFSVIGFCGGWDLTPHGNIDYLKRCGLSPTSTAVSLGERGDGLQVLVV